MDLPNLFSDAKNLDARVCICSIISETTVQCLLLKVSSGGTKILHKSGILVYSDAATLVVRMDEALQDLGKESESINEVLFALDAAWLESGDLVAAKKPLLQKVCADLALRPLGFIIQSEALVQHSINRNSHFSAIFMVLTNHSVTLNIVSQGKEVYTQSVGRSADIVADLREAFARFVKEKRESHLPGKMVCASFSLTEEEVVSNQQQLLDAEWGPHVPFVQTPTIDIIKPDLATSIIAEQAGDSIISPAQTDQELDTPQSENLPVPHSLPNDKTDSGIRTEKTPEPELTEVNPADFGFSTVPTEKLAHIRHEERAVETDTDVLPTSFGIPIKQGVIPADDKEEHYSKHIVVAAPTTRAGKIFAKIFHKHVDHNGKVHYNHLSFIVVGVLTGLLALLIGLTIWIFFFSSVVIAVKPIQKTVAKDVSLTLDPGITTSDVLGLKIPAKKVSIDLKTETEGTTTGIKIVGDKAKGEVVIYNKTSGQKSFPSGTVLKQGDLQFVTTADVTINAAKEEETGNQKTTTYGEGKVGVTAYVIGVEGNIAKDSELSVANFDKSSYTAKAADTFAGGTSREVRVISKEDRELLLSEAKKKLLQDSEKQLKEKSGNGTYVLPSTELAITKTVYSGEVETPTETVSLKVEATVNALAYEQKDVVVLASEVLKDQLDPAYELTAAPPEVLSAPAAAGTSKAVTIKANISMKALPKLDFASLEKEVAGMEVSKAKAQLEGKKIFSTVDVTFTPRFAQSMIQTLPKQPEKITFSEIH